MEQIAATAALLEELQSKTRLLRSHAHTTSTDTTAMDHDVPFYAQTMDPLQTEIQLAFLQFRQHHRRITSHVQHAKQRTQLAKERMDATRLTLQNLRYEQQHLERELEQCLDFRTLYDQIPLIPLNLFQQEAPQILTQTEDAHQLMLNRLQHELNERRRLMTLFESEDAVRTSKMEELKQQKERVDKLENQFDMVVKVSRSLQEAVGYGGQQEKEQQMSEDKMEDEHQHEADEGEEERPEKEGKRESERRPHLRAEGSPSPSMKAEASLSPHRIQSLSKSARTSPLVPSFPEK